MGLIKSQFLEAAYVDDVDGNSTICLNHSYLFPRIILMTRASEWGLVLGTTSIFEKSDHLISFEFFRCRRMRKGPFNFYRGMRDFLGYSIENSVDDSGHIV